MSTPNNNFENSDAIDHDHMSNVLLQLSNKVFELTGKNKLIQFKHHARTRNYHEGKVIFSLFHTPSLVFVCLNLYS